MRARWCPCGNVRHRVFCGEHDCRLEWPDRTAQLAVPTAELINEETLFEGWVTRATDRRVFSEGHIIQGGVVTVEAEGEFAVFERSDVDRMAAGRRAAFDDAMRRV